MRGNRMKTLFTGMISLLFVSCVSTSDVEQNTESPTNTAPDKPAPDKPNCKDKINYLNAPEKSVSYNDLFLHNSQNYDTDGFCFQWAIAVTDRILGKTEGKMTPDEWEAISKETNKEQSKPGGTDWEYIYKYWENRGFSIESYPIGHDVCSPYYYAAQKIEDGCLVMVYMNRGKKAHIETVVGIDGCSALTNSWGEEGHITTNNDSFQHTARKTYNGDAVEGSFYLFCKSEIFTHIQN